MIKLLAGGKGGGKTKRLIDMSNEAVKTTDGHIVFIDDDRRHIYDLHYDIRFVDTTEFPLSNYRELVGFIYGILSQDNDIVEIYIDGIQNIIKTFDYEAFEKLRVKLDKISAARSVEFFMVMNCENMDELPQSIKELTI